jgi:ATP-dependent Lhr-like helicase
MAAAFGAALTEIDCFDLAAPGKRIRPDFPKPRPKTDEGNDLLADWVAEWLRFRGPLAETRLLQSLPARNRPIEEAVAALTETGILAADLLTDDARETQVCDVENLEILLRMSRAAARPAFQPRPVEEWPLFLASWQGVVAEASGAQPATAETPVQPGDSETRMQPILESLFGYPLPAEMLEREILPARMPGYRSADLDLLAQQSDLMWFGCGPKRIAVGFPEHADLCRTSPDAEDEMDLLPDPRGRYAFEDLLEAHGGDSAGLTQRLWEAAWAGRVANDGFEALRKGVQTKFRPVSPKKSDRPLGRRRAFNRWKAARPFAGAWYALPAPRDPSDPLEAEEQNKDRVRMLIDRCGVLFREALDQELPPLRWGALFRTLRLMELSGELVAGQFFEGPRGLQFTTPEVLRNLRMGLPQDAVYWLNAADPASPCGVNLEPLKPHLPKRLASTHLVYQGARLVLVSERNGKRLTIHAEPEHPRMSDFLGVFDHFLARSFQPRSSIRLETVNDQPANASPYLKAFRERFDAAPSPNHVTIRPKVD